MATKYPSKIDDNISLPLAVDQASIFTADVYNRLRAAIIAVETELGVKPSSIYGTVKGRLDFLEDNMGGGGGSPGGSDTQVQFNDGGSFGGDAGLTFDKSLGILSLTDVLSFGSSPASTGTIRLQNTDNIYSLNSLGIADHVLAGTDSSDNLFVGGNIDGSLAHPQVFISAASFGFLRANGSDAMLWSASNILAVKPIIGYAQPYSVHGGTATAFVGDTDYTTADYIYDWNEYTVGDWTAGHAVIYPAPASKIRGYYKTIFNNTIYPITVSIGSGTTQTLDPLATKRFWFDNSGVSITDTSSSSQQEISFVAAENSTTSLVFTRVGARQIDLSSFPTTIGALTRQVEFIIDVQKTPGATSVEVELFDATNVVQVTSTDIVYSATNDITEVSSGPLTIGASPGDLRDDAPTMYEVHFKMNGGGGGDAVFITNARVVVSYA